MAQAAKLTFQIQGQNNLEDIKRQSTEFVNLMGQMRAGGDDLPSRTAMVDGKHLTAVRLRCASRAAVSANRRCFDRIWGPPAQLPAKPT